MSAELQASRRDATLILTLSNPSAKNALHPDIYAAAIETLSTAERDGTIRAVVLTGADRIFSSGASLHRLLDSRVRPPDQQGATAPQASPCLYDNPVHHAPSVGCDSPYTHFGAPYGHRRRTHRRQRRARRPDRPGLRQRAQYQPSLSASERARGCRRPTVRV